MSKNSLEEVGVKGTLLNPVSRATFLKYSGATIAAASLAMAGCSSDSPTTATISLGSNDTGILNYAYLLEQLEAAFYIQVVATPYTGITASETTILTDIMGHEKCHRDFFKKAIATGRIQDNVSFDFSKIDFKSRAAVLGAAKTFEDLGVSAYNGAGKLIQSADYLLLAGKIVSVEARHASAIRDLLNPYSADFSGDDVVTPAQGLDGALLPPQVLAAAGVYVKGTVKFDQLPTA